MLVERLTIAGMTKGAYVILAALLLSTRGAAAEPIRIGVSDFVYADLAHQIGDPAIAVTLLKPEKATANGVTAFAQIEVVVCSGTKADALLCDTAKQISPPPIVIEGLHYATNRRQGLEFLWYDFKGMLALTQKLAAEMSRRMPAEARIAANLTRTQQAFQAIDLKMEEIAKVYRNADVIITDGLFRGLVERLRLKVQDDDYVSSQQRGVAPSAKSIATLKNALQRREASILLYDQDASTPAIRDLAASARDNGTPVVGLRETLPRGLHYQQWMLRQLNAIYGALDEFSAVSSDLCSGRMTNSPLKRWIALAFLVAALLGAASPAAEAHPHVLIESRAEILFNAQGQVIGVTNVWDFDDAFSAYAIQGYDSKHGGNPTRQDLQPLAEINIQSLAEYNYFTRVKITGANVAFAHPKDYFDVFAHEKLTLHFTLPLAKPLDVRGETLEVDVYDPAYFAAITFANERPVTLIGAKGDCESMVHRPEALNPAIASQLAVIPANQRSLPPELFAVTDKLVNAVRIICK